MNSEPLNQKGEHTKGRTTLLGPETGLMTFERDVERSESDPRIPHNSSSVLVLQHVTNRTKYLGNTTQRHQYSSKSTFTCGSRHESKRWSKVKAGWMKSQRKKRCNDVPLSPHQPHVGEMSGLKWCRTGRDGSTLCMSLYWISPSFFDDGNL